MKQEPILEVKNLTKRFGKFTAVDNISFSLKEGEILGFLGPNGAGKTTTIQMLLGITSSSGGSISYFGKDFYKNREYCLSRINYASAFNTLQGRITVWENLLVFAHLYGVKNAKKKIEELSASFEADDLLNQRYWDISAGQKTRVNIIKSLINNPKIILMDEATASLDPDIADKTLSFIEKMKETQNISLLYTSHDMNEITRICDEVIFIDHGHIVAKDTPLNLTKKIKNAEIILAFDGEKEKLEKYLVKEKLNYEFLKEYLVSIKASEDSIPKIIIDINKAGLWITDIEINKPTLEDFFLNIARGGTNVTE